MCLGGLLNPSAIGCSASSEMSLLHTYSNWVLWVSTGGWALLIQLRKLQEHTMQQLAVSEAQLHAATSRWKRASPCPSLRSHPRQVRAVFSDLVWDAFLDVRMGLL